MAQRSEGEVPPVDFDQVLERELQALHLRRKRRFRDFRENAPSFQTRTTNVAALGDRDTSRTAEEKALYSDLVGLSFSGGGIRSATFHLGVLQGLANLKLLPYFDYLSTVSGGGYVGSWLTALIHRHTSKKENAEGILEIQERLQTLDGRRSGFQEEPSIRWLRQYSNYLTPKAGALTADTWAVVTTYLRNLLLNVTILIPALGLLLLVPQCASWGEGWLRAQLDPGIILASALGFAMIAVLVMGLHMASFSTASRPGKDPWWLTQGGVQALIVAPLGAAAFLTTLWMPNSPEAPVRSWMLYIAGAYTLSWFLSWCLATGLMSADETKKGTDRRLTRVLTDYGKEWSLLARVAPFAGLLAGLLLYFTRTILTKDSLTSWERVAWGPPMILGGFALVAAIQIGLAGRKMHDHQREWLSRVAAWLLIYGIGWAGIFAVVLYGPVMTLWTGEWVRAGLTAGWLLSTVAGLLATRTGGGSSPGLARRLIAFLAPYIFIGGLLMLLTYGMDRSLFLVADGEMQPGTPNWEYFTGTHERLLKEAQAANPDAEKVTVSGAKLFSELNFTHLKILQQDDRPLNALRLALLLLGVLIIQGVRIDINEFSMHRLYRNRLVRCFLAASQDQEQRQRQRQPFTGFAQDDIPMGQLRDGDPAPLHILNTALNLVGGSELAWQERKAASFVFTPLHCGFQKSDQEGAFRPTDRYGNSPKPLTLGSALAISGAAASPNMGFRTTPALAFLLTIFNVRLGWWIGNPWRKHFWTHSGPSFSIANLLAEVLGKTQDDRRFVYLSDGGHFENLGIYELVRRRCRFILAGDAGADPQLTFEDLGNAIRKCRTDLGVEITIRTDQICPGPDGKSRWHCAMGEIDYREGGATGTLLYLKASLTGDEPEDLRNYSAKHAEFPHESTGDQWFDESQFESYRRLGLHIVEEVLGEEAQLAEHEAERQWQANQGAIGRRSSLPEQAGRPLKISFEHMVHRLRERWYPQSSAPGEAFTRHGEALEALFERLRGNDELAFLDEQFYPEWQALQTGTPSVRPSLWLPRDDEGKMRHGFYFCNSLIQLMENVYYDLHLQEEFSHPDNRGWMNLFKHWSWSGMFQATWAVSAVTYGHRFQDFCHVHLGLKALGDVSVQPVVFASGQGGLGRKEFEAEVEKGTQLNFFERAIIGDFLGEEGNQVSEVWEIRLTVPDPISKPDQKDRFYFGCGFALVWRGRIVCYRIQDHLRNAGLGRRGVLALYQSSRGGPGIQGEPKRGTIPIPYRSDFTAEGETHFLELFRSVQRQVEEEESSILDTGIESGEFLASVVTEKLDEGEGLA